MANSSQQVQSPSENPPPLVEGQSAFRPCIVVPVYNHAGALPRTLDRLADSSLCSVPIFLVDDGSTDNSLECLRSAAARSNNITVIERPINGGKGAACLDGMRAALKMGRTHVLQIDCDGQHQVEDIPRFFAEGRSFPEALILGRPLFGDSAPLERIWGRKLSNALVRLETLRLAGSNSPLDALCGFRLYPLRLFAQVIVEDSRRLRMDFDIDVLVRLCWAGCEVRNIDTPVTYPRDGISHFSYLRDNAALTLLHIRLLLRMLARLPVGRRFTAKTEAEWSDGDERGSLFWTRFLFSAVRILGRRFCLVFAYPAVLYFVIAATKERRASRDYLRRVLGFASPDDVPWRMVYRHFLEFAKSLIDKAAVWTGSLTLDDLEWQGKNEMKSRIYSGQGVIIVSAHVGTMEVIRALSSEFPELRVRALMYTKHTGRYNQILRQTNAESFLSVFPMESVGPQTITTLQAALSRGESLGILADRITAGAPEKTVAVNFLGADAHFPSGPFILASLLGAPVYLCFALRQLDGRYEVAVERFAEQIALPRANRQEALRDHVQRFASRLEETVRAHPLQWFNFYDFWRKRPSS